MPPPVKRGSIVLSNGVGNIHAGTEASIMDAIEACFLSIDVQCFSTSMTRHMGKCLQLAGCIRDGKITSGSRHNQVKFTNPSPRRTGLKLIAVLDLRCQQACADQR